MTPFPSYWRSSKKQTESFSQSAVIALDTNVLLDLYRVTPQARNEIFAVLEEVVGRVFIPHQVALEFHKNRIKAAKEQLDFYNATRGGLDSLKAQAIQKLAEFANRCALPVEEKEILSRSLKTAFSEVVDGIKAYQDRFDLTEDTVLNSDPILAKLSKLLHEKVGPPLDSDQTSAALAEASRRREAKIPPGFKDGRKGSNPHGDYFVWEQILLEAERRKTSILLVSNDNKEDWVHKESDFTIGPRSELVDEMRKRADVEFRILSFPDFLEVAKRKAPTAVSDQTLKQAKLVQRRERFVDYPTFVVKMQPNVVEAMRRDLTASEARAESSLLSARGAEKRLSPSAPDHEKQLNILDLESASRMVESVKEDITIFERSIESAKPGENDELILDLPIYMRRRIFMVLAEVASLDD